MSATGTKPDGQARPEDVLLEFESLGDNCEFGVVQGKLGLHPLGLLRFAGMNLPNVVRALEAKFEGIGTPETLRVHPSGDVGTEFMMEETWLQTRYHTFHNLGDIEPDALREKEANRLRFLRRKMLEDLAVGEKIWIWREYFETDPARLLPLLNVLRSFGPNKLLMVVAADDAHPAGTVEFLDRDFLRGYVERLAPYADATDSLPYSWLEMCRNAYRLLHPLPRALLAMDFLAQHPASIPAAQPSPPRRRFMWPWQRSRD